MDDRLYELIYTLAEKHSLSLEEYQYLIDHRTEEAASLLAKEAAIISTRIYGNLIFTRGLIEISNICKCQMMKRKKQLQRILINMW